MSRSMTESIAFRPATPDDGPLLFQLFASTREEELKMTGWDDAQKHAFLEMQSHAQLSDYRINYPNSGYQIIMLDDRPIGRIFIDRAEDEIHLVDIVLLPEHCGQ